nr:hypothetical protein Iba_chr12dCG6840 [Ipomoea batatas]
MRIRSKKASRCIKERKHTISVPVHPIICPKDDSPWLSQQVGSHSATTVEPDKSKTPSKSMKGIERCDWRNTETSVTSAITSADTTPVSSRNSRIAADCGSSPSSMPP